MSGKMNRIITFRGLKYDVWKYGNLSVVGDCTFIDNGIGNREIVEPETVGQYIGKKDKNDKFIFEGDILSGAWKTLLLVYYDEASTSFLVKDCNGHSSPIDYYDNNRIEIVGNIHDNPELMKGGMQ